MGRAARTSKLCSLAEAAALVADGARIALGGFAVYQHPIAFVHELIRQGRRDLSVVGVVNGNEVDLLAAAGAIKRIETSYVGLEKYGLAQCFRRAVEGGALEVVDYPELLSWDRFRASQENQTFVQADFLGGTDIVRHNPDIKPFTCPLTGKKLWAVPPADPEVVVIHAIMGDAHGNVLMPAHHLMPQSLDITLSRCCDTVIVTVEKIVEPAAIRRLARFNQVPSYRTTCIVEVPGGAHPCPVLGHSAIDDVHFRAYVEASETEDGMGRYLDDHVLGVTDHAGYLQKVGLDRELDLRRATPLG